MEHRSSTSISHGVILVINSANIEDAATLNADIVVTGGSSRGESVRNGLKALPESATIVVVHDAARPDIDQAFESVINAVEAGADAAVPGTAIPTPLNKCETDLAAKKSNARWTVTQRRFKLHRRLTGRC